MKVLRENDGAVVVEKCSRADTYATRSVGLLKHRTLPEEEGLLIVPCNSVHTFFMRFPIDVVFLDRHDKIITIYKDMKPWRISWIHLTAFSVLELASGVASSISLSKGQKLIFR